MSEDNGKISPSKSIHLPAKKGKWDREMAKRRSDAEQAHRWSLDEQIAAQQRKLDQELREEIAQSPSLIEPKPEPKPVESAESAESATIAPRAQGDAEFIEGFEAGALGRAPKTQNGLWHRGWLAGVTARLQALESLR